MLMKSINIFKLITYNILYYSSFNYLINNKNIKMYTFVKPFVNMFSRKMFNKCYLNKLIAYMNY